LAHFEENVNIIVRLKKLVVWSSL